MGRDQIMKVSPAMLIFGAGGGAIGYFVGEWILILTFRDIPMPLQVALYMAVLGFFIVGMCLLAETLFPIINGVHWKRNYAGISWRYFLPAAVIPLLAWGALMQAIFQWERISETPQHIYILIDRSGSMGWNDPHDERLDSVMRLIDIFNPIDSVEIIAFDHLSDVTIPLINVGSDGAREAIAEEVFAIVPIGGTQFDVTLRHAFERIVENGSYLPGIQTSVILLSDGFSYLDERILHSFIDQNIPVHTVGFALPDIRGEEMLEFIATRTNGMFVLVDVVEELDAEMHQLYQVLPTRFILHTEPGWHFDILQWLLYAVAGTIVALISALLFDNRYTFRPLILGGIIGGIAAGVALSAVSWSLLIPNILLGAVFPLFTLFSRTPSTTGKSI